MTSRKFYKTTFEVTVLSEEPVNFDCLASMHTFITEDEGVGEFKETGRAEVDGKTMAGLLYEVGSEPGFFRLTDEGDEEDPDNA